MELLEEPSKLYSVRLRQQLGFAGYSEQGREHSSKDAVNLFETVDQGRIRWLKIYYVSEDTHLKKKRIRALLIHSAMLPIANLHMLRKSDGAELSGSVEPDGERVERRSRLSAERGKGTETGSGRILARFEADEPA